MRERLECRNPYRGRCAAMAFESSNELRSAIKGGDVPKKRRGSHLMITARRQPHIRFK